MFIDVIFHAEECDSFMYQSVGVRCVGNIAEAMRVPLYTRIISGSSLNTTAHYSKPLKDDEVEDLYHLLKEVKVCVYSIMNFFQLTFN